MFNWQLSHSCRVDEQPDTFRNGSCYRVVCDTICHQCCCGSCRLCRCWTGPEPPPWLLGCCTSCPLMMAPAQPSASALVDSTACWTASCGHWGHPATQVGLVCHGGPPHWLVLALVLVEQPLMSANSWIVSAVQSGYDGQRTSVSPRPLYPDPNPGSLLDACNNYTLAGHKQQLYTRMLQFTSMLQGPLRGVL